MLSYQELMRQACEWQDKAIGLQNEVLALERRLEVLRQRELPSGFAKLALELQTALEFLRQCQPLIPDSLHDDIVCAAEHYGWWMDVENV